MALNITPNANDRISDTQPLIRQNFNTINDAFDVNHGEYLTGDQGKHKFITFVGQNPAPTFLGTDEGMYSVASIAGPNPTINGPEIYLKKFYASGTLSRDIPFTASFISNTAAVNIVNDIGGWTYLPSGLLIKWGKESDLGVVPFPGIPNRTFPTGANIPVFTNCFAIFVTPRNQNASDNGVVANAPVATGFNAGGTNFGSSQYYWLAIGW